MGKFIAHSHIHTEALSSTSFYIVRQNSNRRSLLIINGSAKTIYISTNKSFETNQAIVLNPNDSYSNEHYCQGEYVLFASDTCVVNLEECYCQD